MKSLFWGAFATCILTFPVQAQGRTDAFLQTWRGVARVKTLQKTDSLRDLSASFPVFTSKRPVARVAGAVLKREATASFNAAVKDSRGTRQSLGMPGDLKFAQEWKPRLVYQTPKLISANALGYTFRGGAHGMYATSGYVFGTPKGEKSPRRLKLADFFVDEKRALPRVNALLMKKLRATKGTEQEAMWVLDGSVKSLTAGQLENFAATKSGLTWTFSPYEVGPYANGEYEVSLSTKELGRNFRASMLK